MDPETVGEKVEASKCEKKMGSDQSLMTAGASGSTLKSQRDEEIPYTQYSISKPIDSSPRLSPNSGKKLKSSPKLEREGGGGTPKHDIVVVAEGNTSKSVDPEVVKLDSIPVFFPIMKGSLNNTNNRESELLDKLDYRQVLLMCMRYQEHLKQLSEAVAFDQNALCIRIKEIDHTVAMLLNKLNERQRKFTKYAEQTKRINETLATLQKIQKTMDGIVPKMDNLNKLLPPEDQLESFSMRPKSISS